MNRKREREREREKKREKDFQRIIVMAYILIVT